MYSVGIKSCESRLTRSRPLNIPYPGVESIRSPDTISLPNKVGVRHWLMEAYSHTVVGKGLTIENQQFKNGFQR
jgi:hypothetical protein